MFKDELIFQINQMNEHVCTQLLTIIGELHQAVLKNDYEKGDFENIPKEAAQVGAMALRFLVNL